MDDIVTHHLFLLISDIIILIYKIFKPYRTDLVEFKYTCGMPLAIIDI